jgi:hypothetical protein
MSNKATFKSYKLLSLFLTFKFLKKMVAPTMSKTA